MSNEVQKFMPQLFDLKLTDKQLKAWQQTKADLLWNAPGFTHILMTMLNPKEDDGIVYWTRDIDTAATDGEILIFNPEFFFTLNLKERTFVVCHEIAHAIMFHMLALQKTAEAGHVVHNKKQYKFDADNANRAMDYIINDLLVVSKMGIMPSIGLHDPTIGKHDDEWPAVFAKLVNNPPPKGQAGGSGSGGSGKRVLDTHLPPGVSQGRSTKQAEELKDSPSWNNAIKAAAAIQKESMGRGDASGNALDKFFKKLIEPKVDWQEHIFGELAKNVGSGGYDFKRPDRKLIARDIFAPSKSGKGVGTVGVFIDSSGSIYSVPNLITRFFSEVEGMLRSLRPRRIVVVWCDSKVRRVDIIDDEDDLETSYHKGASGGGGTAFEPPFKKLHKLVEEGDVEPVCAVVYLTDGDGSFPRQEDLGDYPVIWGDISGDKTKYPFGEVIMIPTDGTA